MRIEVHAVDAAICGKNRTNTPTARFGVQKVL